MRPSIRRVAIHCLSLLAGLCLASTAQAQYTLSHEPRPYEWIEGGERLPMRWDDTVNPYTYVDFGNFTFTLFGKSFTLGGTTPMGISKWGNVEIFNSESVVIIDPFHSSILDSMQPTTEVTAMASGKPGSRVVKIQWKNMNFEGASSETFVNFQLWLFEVNGRVEFFYGPHSIGCDESDPALQGAYVGMFIAPLDFSVINKIFWVTGKPSDPKVSKTSIKAMKCVFPPDYSVALNSTAVAFVDRSEESEQIEPGLVARRSLTLNASDVTVYSLLGQKVMSVQHVEGELLLEFLPRGRYFIEYYQDGERVRRALLLL
jgi:hypothetical protein